MNLVYEKIAELVKDKKEFVVATVVNAKLSTPGKTGFKAVILPDRSFFGTVGGGALEGDVLKQAEKLFINHKSIFKTYVLKEGRENALGICGGTVQIYMEHVGERTQLVILGAGHISKAIYDIIDISGEYNLLVSDTRPKFANKIRFPKADLFVESSFYDAILKIPIKNEAIVVSVTADGNEDPFILKGLFEKNVNYKYVGMIGSANRRNKCFEKAKEIGVPGEFLNKIYSPVGLAIGADTPFEIAISILSEIIAAKSNVLGGIKTEKDVLVKTTAKLKSKS